jgi:Mlc titration factor MtfA (ptsG expression regulator)
MFYVFLISVFLLALYFLFRKKNKNSKSELEHKNYQPLLLQHVDFYQALDEDKKTVFENLVNAFLEDTRVEGVGLEITDLDRVLIASSAVIPVFGFPGWRYKNLTNVLLYPNTFNQEFQFEGGERRILGMVGTGYMNGQMLLSRSALIHGFSKNNGKENTAIHEFVHLLDKTDGATDGIPEILIKHEYAISWLKMIHQEMRLIEKGKSDINPYALTNEAEFFAVTSEYFFEKPEQFSQHHPELYDLMSKMFLQDLASK